MTLRTHTIKKKNPKHSQEWSWEETPELLAAIEQLKQTEQRIKDIGTPKKIFIPNKNYPPIKKKNG